MACHVQQTSFDGTLCSTETMLQKCCRVQCSAFPGAVNIHALSSQKHSQSVEGDISFLGQNQRL